MDLTRQPGGDNGRSTSSAAPLEEREQRGARTGGTPPAEAYDWRGRAILDTRGERIGRIDQVYFNPETNEPEWAQVDRGLFARRLTFVPVRSARPTGRGVQVQVAKVQVKSAPDMEGDAAPSPEEEAELRRHYGVENRGTPPFAAPARDRSTDALSGDGAIPALRRSSTCGH